MGLIQYFRRRKLLRKKNEIVNSVLQASGLLKNAEKIKDPSVYADVEKALSLYTNAAAYFKSVKLEVSDYFNEKEVIDKINLIKSTIMIKSFQTAVSCYQNNLKPFYQASEIIERANSLEKAIENMAICEKCGHEKAAEFLASWKVECYPFSCYKKIALLVHDYDSSLNTKHYKHLQKAQALLKTTKFPQFSVTDLVEDVVLSIMSCETRMGIEAEQRKEQQKIKDQKQKEEEQRQRTVQQRQQAEESRRAEEKEQERIEEEEEKERQRQEDALDCHNKAVEYYNAAANSLNSYDTRISDAEKALEWFQRAFQYGDECQEDIKDTKNMLDDFQKARDNERGY